MNCLQFFIFTRFFAVNLLQDLLFYQLWIAYNFLSLQGSLQYFLFSKWFYLCCELLTIFYLYKVLCSYFDIFFQMPIGCELLTIFYLYKVLCSLLGLAVVEISVVNCLQFFIFTRFFAVATGSIITFEKLWIAYNFLSLQGSLQSFSNTIVAKSVVNCLQFFIFTRFFAVFATNRL